MVDMGSKERFVDDALLIFKSQSTKDYHEEMDAERLVTCQLKFDNCLE